MSSNKIKLGEILLYEQPTKYIVATENYNDNYKTPVLTAGKSFVLGYTNETTGIYSKLPVIIFDDFTTESKFVDFPFKVKSSAMKILKCDSRIADIKFLYYWLKTVNFNAEQHKRYWISTFANFEISLPPLSIQKHITEILDAADTLRRKDQELLKKYDELAHAIFIDMFGDPVRNEKKWEVRKLKEISVKIHSGNTPNGGSNVYVKSGITFFRSQNVWKNNLIYDDIAFIDEKTHKSMMKSSLKHKDILMTKTGRVNTENSSLGRAALFLGKDDTANVNGHVYLIRLKQNQMHEFIVHILTTKQYRDLIREVCVGGIDKRQLNKDHIEDFPIIYPPLNLQQKFKELVTIIQEQKKKAEISAAKSEEIFSSLIQKAFKGELINEDARTHIEV